MKSFLRQCWCLFLLSFACLLEASSKSEVSITPRRPSHQFKPIDTSLSSKSDGSITPRRPTSRPIVAYVHFDIDRLLSTHIATIQHALHVNIYDHDEAINVRNLWGILHYYARITKKTQFYSEIFTIGYLLNEAPSAFRFALMSETFDPLLLATREFTILSIRPVEDLYAVLDVVKAAYEGDFFDGPNSDVFGIFIGRPGAERKFDLQLVVRKNAAQVKFAFGRLLSQYKLPHQIVERVEQFKTLRNIFAEPSDQSDHKSETVGFFLDVDRESSLVLDENSETGKPRGRSRSRGRVHFSLKDDKKDQDSPKPHLSRSLVLPEIDEIRLKDYSPPSSSPQKKDSRLKLPGVPASRSADSLDSMTFFQKTVLARDPWLRDGHANPHLGRKAAWNLKNSQMTMLETSSSDSTDA